MVITNPTRKGEALIEGEWGGRDTLDTQPAREPGAAAGHQRPDPPGERALGLAVDPLRGDHHDPPLGLVQALPTFQVAVPLANVRGVLPPVVLHDHPEPGVGQVEAHHDVTVLVADRVVHHRLRQPRQHDEHPQPGLHRGVNVLPDEPRRRPGGHRMTIGARGARVDQVRRPEPADPEQGVAHDHEVHE